MRETRLVLVARATLFSAALALALGPRAGRAQPLGATLTASCLGGAIGCTQVDFLLRLTDPTASTALDDLRLDLTGPGWMFADPNLSEAQDATGLIFVDPVVGALGTSMTANFPFGALVDPQLRVRAAFTQFDMDVSSLRATLAGDVGGRVVVSGTLATVPEPSAAALLAAGLAIVAGVRRARRARPIT